MPSASRESITFDTARLGRVGLGHLGLKKFWVDGVSGLGLSGAHGASVFKIQDVQGLRIKAARSLGFRASVRGEGFGV